MRLALASWLALAALAATACNSGFVKGWGKAETERTAEISAPDRCEARPGFSWVGGSCKEDSSLALATVETPDDCHKIEAAGWWDGQCIAYADASEEQCGEVVAWSYTGGKCVAEVELACEADPAATWTDGVCVGRPALTADGALAQTVSAGNAIAPVRLTLSAGALVELRDQSCPNYFAIDGARLTSADGYGVPAGAAACTAFLVPKAGEAEGDPVAVEVTFARGFFAICNDPAATDAELGTALAIMRSLEKVDCKEANADLTQVKRIILQGYQGQRLSDLSALRGLTQLEWLDVSQNRVTDLSPIAGASNLIWLDVTGNKLDSLVPIATLPKLTRLLISDGDVEKTEATCPTAAGTAAPVIRACTP